jgi:hypothetical protein
VTIATTYMSHFLEMDAKEIGIVFFVALIMGAPGAKLGEYVALATNPLFSVKCCDIVSSFWKNIFVLPHIGMLTHDCTLTCSRHIL